MRRFEARMALTLLAMLLVGALAAGCGTTTARGAGGSSSKTTSTATTASAASGVVIHTKTVTVNGKSVTALADSKGSTLYYFMPDTSGNVACTASCAAIWPPLLSPSGAPTSASALPGKLSALNGANGQQVLYNGHPLYTYSKDGDEGDAYGEGVGGKWFVATPALPAQ
jgi:predicted lipoprotein with Yx(FWY)xxD motif